LRGVLVPITSLAQETMLRHIDRGGIGPHSGVALSRGADSVTTSESEWQDGARDTMVFIAGAAITHPYGNTVGSSAELSARVSGLSIPLP